MLVPGADLLGDPDRGLTQGAATGMAEERAPVVDVAVALESGGREVEAGDAEHREVAVRVEWPRP